MKSRIVALALIGILLSSSLVSVANAYTITFAISEINGNTVHNFIQPSLYQMDLFDGVDASLDKKTNNPFRINLFDGILSSLDKNYNPEQKNEDKPNLRIISVKLKDGVAAKIPSYVHDGDTVKIVSIKQDHDRRALWERIFPLERIRNGEKQSLYKIIQEDQGLLYLQVNETESDNSEPNDFELFVSESQQHVEKFFGKANYVAENLADHIKRLSDVDKFVG